MSNGGPLFLEVRTVGEAIKLAQHHCEQGLRFLEPFDGVKVLFSLGELVRFSNRGFQHLVEIEPRLSSFNKSASRRYVKGLRA